MQASLDEAGGQLDRIKKQKDEILETHAFMCNFYGIDKNDEAVKKAELFFKTFVEFLNNVIKSLPKEEKKRPGAAGGKPKVGYGSGGVNPMMAEMMAKKAAGGIPG